MITALNGRITYLEGLITYEVIIPDNSFNRDIPLPQYLAIPYWPVEEHKNVTRRIHCESKGITNATNGNHIGLLQINQTLFSLDFPDYAHLDLFDPNDNLLAGYLIWQRYGWRMWECK